MGWRCLSVCGILLLCFMVASCSNKDGLSDNIIGKEQSATASGEQSDVTTADDQSPEEGQNSGEVGELSGGADSATGDDEDAQPSKDNTAQEEQVTGEEDQTLEDSIVTIDILEAYTNREELMNALSAYPSGTKVNTLGVKASLLEKLFYSEELTEEVKDRINGKSYGEDCDIPYEKLRYIRVLYCGYDGDTYIGELIVNQAIAQDILDIFRELYAIDYPIERMVLVDDYAADDDLSMAANNTSAFNFRFVAGTTRLSKHSLGCAIDINPLYNPYITKLDGKTAVLPKLGAEYVDRTKDCPYYIRKGDPCYEAFISRGFTWGGDWENSKDYQHFQKLIE